MAEVSKDMPLSFVRIPPLGSMLGSVELILGIFVVSLLLVLFFLDQTDVPHIRNLPSVPAVPIFGNLFQLGSEHPKRLAELSKKYGPVFQIRLGNRVCHSIAQMTFWFISNGYVRGSL